MMSASLNLSPPMPVPALALIVGATASRSLTTESTSPLDRPEVGRTSYTARSADIERLLNVSKIDSV